MRSRKDTVSAPKRVIHEPDYGKIEPDWKPVNWVQQSKIRG
jgi:hypothetical protein